MGLSTVLLALVLGYLGWQLVSWAWVHAVFRADLGACEAAAPHGACWGVVSEKLASILLGRYPRDQQWRAALALFWMAVLTAYSLRQAAWRVRTLAVWAVGLPLIVLLMAGGWAGLTPVRSQDWGGLPLTWLLTSVSLGLAFPLGVALALGRRSQRAALRLACTAYIELTRSVPLVSVLFMASFLWPLLLPATWQTEVLLRVLLALSLFVAAYLAEAVRGGLQAVPVDQVDAARALGLTAWQVQRHVVLPQALRHALPALMNTVTGTLKDTSLVTIVSLFELTGALQLAVGGDPLWRPYYLEAYLFIALLYWGMCFSLSRAGRRLERGSGSMKTPAQQAGVSGGPRTARGSVAISAPSGRAGRS